MKARLFLLPILFWPVPVLAIKFAIYFFVTSHGCVISAAGPHPCVIGSWDFSEQVSGLWTLGYEVAFAIIWAIPAAILWGAVELFISIRKQ